MNAKIEPGGRGRIPFLLNCAFKAAKEGDAVEAMHFWRQAIDEGYTLNGKTHRQLLLTIREGEAASLDPSRPPVPRGYRLTDTKPVDIAQRIASRRKTAPPKLD